MSDKIFYIGQHDARPKLFAELGGVYAADYPEDEKRIYNEGDVILLYMEMPDKEWDAVPATVDEVIENGKSIRVSVILDPENVAVVGKYRAYFRNETIKLSFPQDGTFNTIYVTEKGHEAET